MCLIIFLFRKYSCQTHFLFENVSDRFSANENCVRHFFKELPMKYTRWRCWQITLKISKSVPAAMKISFCGVSIDLLTQYILWNRKTKNLVEFHSLSCLQLKKFNNTVFSAVEAYISHHLLWILGKNRKKYETRNSLHGLSLEWSDDEVQAVGGRGD